MSVSPSHSRFAWIDVIDDKIIIVFNEYNNTSHARKFEFETLWESIHIQTNESTLSSNLI